MGPKSRFPFVASANSYLIIGIDESQLDNFFSLAKSIKWLGNQKKKILILNSEIIETLIIYTKMKAIIWLSIEKNMYFSKGFRKPDKAID